MTSFIILSVIIGVAFILPSIFAWRAIKKEQKYSALAKQLYNPENKILFSKRLKKEIKKQKKLNDLKQKNKHS